MAAEGAHDLRTYLTAMSRLVSYAARPGDMPAAAVLGQFALDGGVAYLHGGWQSIVDGLAARAVEAAWSWRITRR
ncbi:MAG: hypothetical protein R2697_15120 [Ilumatobacteraceae bacterium]